MDGAQDFKTYDPSSKTMRHDDAYLSDMNHVVQTVAGQHYLPYMIFEDGRPWPRDDWELASTYREVTKQLPNVFQWGPLTFAHNTPFLFTFWLSKWWRIREVCDEGSHWITGCANHDTLRRGTQVAIDARINTYLGDNLPAIFRKAYDNPAAKLFDYAVMPGVPMDFINASMHAPWSFIRNTDDRYGVKVVSEEARFLYWALNENLFERPSVFPRLKALGFTTLVGLRHFMDTLAALTPLTGDDLTTLARMMQASSLPGTISPDSLKQVARAWMDDVHDLCNVSHYTLEAHNELADFNLNLRQFRRQRRWLMQNFGPQDTLAYAYPTESTVLFFGVRHAPDGHESLLFAMNMEGAAREIRLSALMPQIDIEAQWRLALKTPGAPTQRIEMSTNRVDLRQPLILGDSEGVVLSLFS
ncbi:hypothetical protein HC928_11895 [bacterium]|nr:hypothetical protein [bacterium]